MKLDNLGDFLIILIPAGLVLVGMYLLMRSFLKKQLLEQSFWLKKQSSETVIPLRIQAYERMTLFLERISPNNLLLRLYENAQHVGDFQQLILKEIREEYYHNLAQQIYLSPGLWDEVNKAMNEVMVLVNTSAAELQNDDPALNLSKKIFEKVINEEKNPTQEALLLLKKEVQMLF
ncbi:hypothetical protein SAMN06298216_3492 [Spirosomataceae bacterium TFI 002]|nr:hypothetical protein SAMN06298216_3492 [Spirosomataceae bacterium TFI 002]